MPMVTKITSAFRTWIGSDGTLLSPGPRKRSWESCESKNVEDDVLETPQAKRSKHSHEDLSSPIVKVANWIRRKATSFGDNYFFRPVTMENGHNAYDGDADDNGDDAADEHDRRVTPGPYQSTPDRDLKRSPIQRSPIAVTTSKPVTDLNAHHHDKRSLTNGSGLGRSCFDRMQEKPAVTMASQHQTKTTSHQTKQVPSPTSRLSFLAPPETQPRRRTKLQHRVIQEARRSNVDRSRTTASECVRLDQHKHYQMLLQQFTKAPVGSFTPNDSLARDSRHEMMTRKPPQPSFLNETTQLGSIIMKPKFIIDRPLHRTRVLPHQYDTKKEIREAARLRLHAPVTELSPSATPYMSKQTVDTPSQPDFTRCESPVIVSVQPAPRRSSSLRSVSELTPFELSRSSLPYAMEDWVKDLKERFESSVQIQQEHIKKERATVGLYKQQRDDKDAEISRKVTENMKLAERLAAVIDEPPTPEVSEEEDFEEDDIKDTDDDVEELEEELPPMTDDMLNKVNNALRPQPSNQILVEGFRIRLTRADFMTLNGLNWLNDEVINFYMNLLAERNDHLTGAPTLHCFNTFFYPKLLKEGQAGLRRWTKKTDIFSKKMIIVPIHLGMHWCMAIIDFRCKRIKYYDSMGSSNQECLEALRDYLIAEHRDKKGSPYDMTGWSYCCPKDIPQQMNGSDCGMFACKFADYISRDKTLSFTQHDMPYFRRRMVWELLCKTLL